MLYYIFKMGHAIFTVLWFLVKIRSKKKKKKEQFIEQLLSFGKQF